MKALKDVWRARVETSQETRQIGFVVRVESMAARILSVLLTRRYLGLKDVWFKPCELRER